MAHRPSFSTRGERVNFDDLRRSAKRVDAVKPKTDEVKKAITVDNGIEVYTSGFIPPAPKSPEELTSVKVKQKSSPTPKPKSSPKASTKEVQDDEEVAEDNE